MEDVWELYKHTKFVMAQPLSASLSFAVITAHNPRGEVMSEAYNRFLDQCLQQDIASLNTPYRSVWGSAPDFSHNERSWAVLADKNTAVELAKQYQQNAIYWINQNQLYLTPCMMSQQNEVHLGEFDRRVVVTGVLPWE
ncbi:DUF3293 domain-containing protein [Corallincola platygyrae]|uniref:DUF3293 domain-containing protein n=1 Tax=Corallincola platygyrae TaxID=1193278 RepID=A0ABW4XPI4_9GAMM